MKWVFWSISFSLASLGTLLLIFSLALVTKPEVPKEDRDAAAGLFFLAVPPLAAAGGLSWTLYLQQRQARQQQQKAEAEALKKLFYDLVQQHQGRLTVLQFAAATNLTGPEAKQYLDERAKEFGADFTAEAAGEVTYHFPL